MSEKVSSYSPSSAPDFQAAATFFEKVMEHFDGHPVAKGVVVGVVVTTAAAIVIMKQNSQSIIDAIQAAK